MAEKEIVSGIVMDGWDGQSALRLGEIDYEESRYLVNMTPCNSKVKELLELHTSVLETVYRGSGNNPESVKPLVDKAISDINANSDNCVVEAGLATLGNPIRFSYVLADNQNGHDVFEGHSFDLKPTKVNGVFVGSELVGDKMSYGVFVVDGESLTFLNNCYTKNQFVPRDYEKTLYRDDDGVVLNKVISPDILQSHSVSNTSDRTDFNKASIDKSRKEPVIELDFSSVKPPRVMGFRSM